MTCAVSGHGRLPGDGHRETRRIPAEILAEERARLHPVPAFTAAFGHSRRVGKDSTIQVDAVRYSVPHTLIEQSVWVRFHGDDLIVTAMVDRQPVEVARRISGRRREADRSSAGSAISIPSKTSKST
jgi:hypothetical protein